MSSSQFPLATYEVHGIGYDQTACEFGLAKSPDALILRAAYFNPSVKNTDMDPSNTFVFADNKAVQVTLGPIDDYKPLGPNGNPLKVIKVNCKQYQECMENGFKYISLTLWKLMHAASQQPTHPYYTILQMPPLSKFYGMRGGATPEGNVLQKQVHQMLLDA